MSTGMINADFVRRRQVEVGLSARQLNAVVGVSHAAVAALDGTKEHGDLTLSHLERLSKALACNIVDLLAEPHDGEADAGAGGDVPGDEDTAVVGQILHTSGVLTPIAVLAEIAGWSEQRTKAAIERLETLLPSVGLALQRAGNRVAVRTAGDVDGDLVAATLRCHINRDGLDIGEVRVLCRILDGDCPKQPSNTEQVSIGVLANARLIEPDGPRNWKVHPDVAYSLGAVADR